MIAGSITSCSGTEAASETTSLQTTYATGEDFTGYVLNPHVYPSLYEQNFDAGTKASFFSFCDALLSGADEFDCPDEVVYYTVLETISHECMPLAAFVVYDDISVKNGKGHIGYSIPHDEYMARADEFRNTVTSILNECIRPEYSDTSKAIALYVYFSEHYTYDDAATSDDFTGCSAYRLLTEHTGICQEIAPAYAYLLLQAGVDCTTCGSLNNVNDAHEWAFATIDGEYYHIDPTWALDDRDGLRYFGMTDDRRAEEGGWDKTVFNYGNANIFDSRGTYKAVSTRFEPLWSAVTCEADYDSDTVMYYSEGSDERKTFRY